jgi:hypothetical protein
LLEIYNAIILWERPDSLAARWLYTTPTLTDERT